MLLTTGMVSQTDKKKLKSDVENIAGVKTARPFRRPSHIPLLDPTPFVFKGRMHTVNVVPGGLTANMTIHATRRLCNVENDESARAEEERKTKRSLRNPHGDTDLAQPTGYERTTRYYYYYDYYYYYYDYYYYFFLLL